MNKVAQLIEDNLEYLSSLEYLDSGKPFSNAAYSAQVTLAPRPLHHNTTSLDTDLLFLRIRCRWISLL